MVLSRHTKNAREALVGAVVTASRRSATAAVMFHSALAAQHDLSATDTRCLELLDRLGPQSAGQIAAYTGLAATSVTALIDRLAARGLVERRADPRDRRKVMVARLAQGDTELTKPYAEIAKATLALLKRYDAAQLRAIADYLNAGADYTERVVASLGAAAKPAGRPKT